MLLLLILGYVLIALIELPPMMAQRQHREIRAFWVMLLISFAVSLSVVMRWPIPSPTDFLEALFAPATRILGLR